MALTDNLISYWKLDEASGSATDAAGASTLTDNNGVGTAAGIISTARSFVAASSQYLSHVDNTDLSTGDIDFTFAAWVYGISGSFPVALSKGPSGAGSREYILYLNGSIGSAKLRWTVLSATSTEADVDWSANMAASTWYYVIVWHDSVNNLIGISVDDGTPVTTAFADGVRDGTGDFQLGASSNQGIYWNGSIDEVGFWKRVLSSGERTSLYNSGAGLAYPFGGGGGATVFPYWLHAAQRVIGGPD